MFYTIEYDISLTQYCVIHKMFGIVSVRDSKEEAQNIADDLNKVVKEAWKGD